MASTGTNYTPAHQRRHKPTPLVPITLKSCEKALAYHDIEMNTDSPKN